jgi:hypothetical protein
LEGAQSERDNCKSNLERVKKEKDDVIEKFAFKLVEANHYCPVDEQRAARN